MGSSKLILIAFFSVFLINLTSALDPYFQNRCVNNGNFSNPSTYQINLNKLFSQLLSTSHYNYGFYNLSVGRGGDQVNAIGLCRGDQTAKVCKTCLNETVSELKKRCPNYKEAVGYSEFCTVHYSSESLYGDMASSPNAILYNIANATDANQFNQVVSSLLSNLSSRAAAGGSLRKYAADNATSPSYFLTVYGLVQCTPDLSQEECSNCLTIATGRIYPYCAGKIGCRILTPSCNLRYETVPFFNTVEEIPRPSPLS